MNKYDMSEYISAIAECCSGISKSWNDESVVALDIIAAIKAKLNEFIISHKKEIMSMYDYAVRGGKYQPVDVPVLIPIMEDFEQYYMDMNAFIVAMLNLTEQSELTKVHIETITKASKVDLDFFNRHFEKEQEMTHTTFPDALEKIELVLRLDVLIGDIQDMYIKLSNIDPNMSDRMNMLIDLYTTSTSRFLKTMSSRVISYISTLMKYKDRVSNPIEEKITGDYKLI